MNRQVFQLILQANAFENEAKEILAIHEDSVSRIITLEGSYKRLQKLSIKQKDMLNQSLKCVEHELFKPAHVMAWAAFIDFLEIRLELDKVVLVRPKWKKVSSLEELRENYPESQIIDASRDLKIITKTQAKALHGLLNKRNECAHPSSYTPNLNETLGYISEIITRIEELTT